MTGWPTWPAEAHAFEEAGRSVGLEPATIRGWLGEIVDSFRAAPPRVTMSHNDLLAVHVLVHDGRLSGIIDFGVVAAEPAANDFAKWDFREGTRFRSSGYRLAMATPRCSSPRTTAPTVRSGSSTGSGICATTT